MTQSEMKRRYFDHLGARTKINLANRDTIILRVFREEALKIMDVDTWQGVLAMCDKYKADMVKKGRL